MVIKQGFQLLNPLCLSLKDKVMLPVRQSYKVSRAIVVFYSIKMVNYPAIRQRLIVRLFPDEDMFHHIASFLSMGMRWLANINISTCTESSATFPLRMLFRRARLQGFNLARFTRILSFRMHLATAYRTYTRIMFGVRQAKYPRFFSSLITAIIFCQRYCSTLFSAIRTIRLLVASRIKRNSAILTFLANHLTYQFNTTQTESQVGGLLWEGI